MSHILVAAMVLTVMAQTPATPVALRDLTIPADRLPAGCVLAASEPERLDNSRVRFWIELPVRTNPWIGTDGSVIALIRERMDGPFPVPDGPPLSRGELSAFRGRLADGIAEGYAAFYRQDESRPEVLSVLAVRVQEGHELFRALAEPRRREASRSVRVRTGQIHAVVFGDDGPCFKIIAAHLTALAR